MSLKTVRPEPPELVEGRRVPFDELRSALWFDKALLTEVEGLTTNGHFWIPIRLTDNLGSKQ